MSFSFSSDRTQQAIIDLQSRNALKSLMDANEINDASIEIAKLKAKKKLSDYKSGVNTTTAQEKEELMSDFERKKQVGDYDLSNQIKAWGAANKYRMSEADQSNIAQKDRLGMQLDTQKTMQDKTIDQENRLRRDDYSRAVNSYTGNF
jgi:hypothetical protein